jgi:hypothetical protein
VSETTAVVYLEADDEITSVVRRVRSADADRVIVVAPGRSRATSSAVALRLLARAGDEDGREVAVVGDPLTRSLAAEAGLAAYATLDEARRAEVPVIDEPAEARHATIHVVRGTDETVATPVMTAEEQTRPVVVVRPPAATSKRRRPLIAMIAAAIAALLVLGLAGAAVLPGATVTIDPLTEEVGPVAYVIDVDEPEQLGGTAEARATVTATGEYENQQPATGTVTLFNWTFFPVTVPAGTFVAAGEQAFATQAEVTVPRGSLTPDGRIAAGDIDVDVVAAAAGPAGNVEAEAINVVVDQSVDAELRGFPENPEPRVLNAEATSGGVAEAGVRFTRRDVNTAVEALTADLRGQIGDAMAEQAGEIVVQPDLAEPTITGLDGLVGTRDQAEATIEGTLDWEAWSADRDDVIDAARQQVVDDPSAVPEGHALLADSVDIAIEEANLDGGRLRVDVSATGRSAAEIDAGDVAQRIAGLTVAEAEAALAHLGSVTVEAWPDWVGSVPSWPWRIEVRVAEP